MLWDLLRYSIQLLPEQLFWGSGIDPRTPFSWRWDQSHKTICTFWDLSQKVILETLGLILEPHLLSSGIAPGTLSGSLIFTWKSLWFVMFMPLLGKLSPQVIKNIELPWFFSKLACCCHLLWFRSFKKSYFWLFSLILGQSYGLNWGVKTTKHHYMD